MGQGVALVTFENRYRAADGSYRWLQWSAGLDVNRQSTYCIARDVTELKRLERQQQAQLAQEAHQQGSIEMASGILHDLGNAFTGMGTRAVELQTKLRADSVERNLKRLAGFLRANEESLGQTLGAVKSRALVDLVEAISIEHESTQKSALTSADKLLAFVGHGQDLITTYRGYSGAGMAPTATELSIPKLVLDAQLMMSDGIGKRGVALDLKCEPNLPTLTAERTKVMQVLINVLKNAAEAFDGFSNAGSLPNISIVARSAEGGVAIDIRDNGCGFGPETASRLFDNGFSTKGRGSGIGLGATRRVIGALNGKISVTSEGAGKGAMATIWLPTKEAAHVQS